MTKRVEEIIRGAGMFQTFITLLVEMVKELGGTMESIYRLTTPEGKETLKKVAEVIVDGVKNAVKHLINLDADPFVPNGWEVVEHQKGGQMEWDPAKVVLYLDEEQKNGGVVVGNKLCQKLTGKPVYNANLLDYLLAHSELIPEEWKGEAVVFWGTRYRGSVGLLYVRYLVWRGVRWDWHYRWLGSDFIGNNPAAVPASN